MPYEKLTVPNRISFYYVLADLLDTASLWSMYKTVSKTNEAGENLVDKLAITNDEADIFNSILSDAVYEVFTKFLKYTKGVTDAIQFNVDYTPSGGQLAKSTYVQIVDNEAYNENYISPVDKALEKCLRFYVLREWFDMKDLDKESQKAGIMYIQNVNLLARHSMELKKPAISI